MDVEKNKDDSQDQAESVDMSQLQQNTSMQAPIPQTNDVQEMSQQDQAEKIKGIFKGIFQANTDKILVSNAKTKREGKQYDVKIKRNSLEYKFKSPTEQKTYFWDFNNNELQIDGEPAEQEFRSEFSQILVEMANDIKAQKAQVMEEKRKA